MEYYNLARLDRKAVLICITVCFVAMVTGVSMQLHLLSHEHSREHDFDDCSICRQLLVTHGKFAPEPKLCLPDTDRNRDSFEFVPEFYITAFHCKSFNARPPPSSL